MIAKPPDARAPNANARRQTGRSAERNLTNRATYCTGSLVRQIAWLRILQLPFGAIFWLIEQKIAKRQEELENHLDLYIRNEQLLPLRYREALRLAISGGRA
jgi:hypothetical protein